MPAMPVEYVRQPYVRGASLGQLLQLQGRNRAEAELRRGEIGANLWGQLGQQITGAIASERQARAEAPRLAQEAEARALQLQNAKDERDARQQLSRQDTAFATFLEGWDGQQEPLFRASLQTYGPQLGPEVAKKVWEAAAGTKKPTREIKVRNPDGSESIQIVEDTPGQTFNSAAAPRPSREIKVRNADGSETIQIVEDTPGQTFNSAAAPKDITYGQPVAATVNGRRAFVRAGSDGKTYSMSGQAITTPVTPVVEQSSDNEPLVAIMGPDGKPVLVRRREAVGKTPATGSQKPASGLEKRALNFFNRARQADLDLEALEDDISGMNIAGQTRLAHAPNFLQSEVGQLYTAAQRAFTEARLRKDSGAAIPEQEFENDRKTYFVQPGDTPAVTEQKRRARGAMLASLGFESGQALGEFVGDADEAAAIVQGYKTRAERKDAEAKATPDLSGLADGRIRRFTVGPFAGQEWTIVNGQPRQVK